MTVEQSRKHHEPQFEVRPYGPSVTTEPAYQAWQDWYAKVRVLRFGDREVDVRFATEADALRWPDDPPVYALHRSHRGWWIMPRDHESTSWPMFVPVFEEYLPESDSVRGHPVQFATMNNEATPGFVFMLAVEMQASILRRIFRDSGVTKEQVDAVRTMASACALEIYNESHTEPPPSENKADDDKLVN
jgi:hypothetical protein